MIRWYDWVLAILAADFMLAWIIQAITGEVWWLQLLGALLVFILWDLWNDYCKLRLRFELGRTK